MRESAESEGEKSSDKGKVRNLPIPQCHQAGTPDSLQAAYSLLPIINDFCQQQSTLSNRYYNRRTYHLK